MPVEIKIKADSIKSKHKEQFEDLKSLLDSISKMKDTLPNKEMFSVIIKKFIYTITTVPDNFFLSDACELTHEMFLEFRIILGYFENGATVKKLKLLTALEDIESISRDLYKLYKEFLSDPGYSGTNFPKPKKIKAMRQLAEIVKDAGDVVILNKNKASRIKKNKKTEGHVAIDIVKEIDSEPVFVSETKLKEMIDSFSQNYFQSDSLDKTNNLETASIDSVSTGSFNPDKGLLKSYDTPLTPRLYSEEVSTIKATGLKMGESVLVAAMGELMGPPPPPPSTKHGKIAYVNSGSGLTDKFALAPPVPYRRSQSLRPPILVDDDGDILPANGPSLSSLQPPPPPKPVYDSIYDSDTGSEPNTTLPETPKGFAPRGPTISSKILDDDDSFIVAYRESVMKATVTMKNAPEENKSKKTTMAVEMESSGWSLKNRI